MNPLTVVEDYVVATMKRAQADRLEDGTLVAYIPGYEGIVAWGADSHECAQELYRRLGDWVKVGLSRGITLPVVDGIGLNTDSDGTLATYHPYKLAAAASKPRKVYRDANELRQALLDRQR